jgi:hypothetical protein
MKLQSSPTIGYLADHLKSVWTLSAGGIAFGTGLLGFVSKDVRIPWYGYVISIVFVFGGLCLYMRSVLKGIRAHRRLIGAVYESEKSEPNDEEAEQTINVLLDLYDQSRRAFLRGSTSLGLGVLFFIAWSVLSTQTNPGDLVISLKNASVITQDSRRIEIEELSFKITDPRSLSQRSNTVEIQDLVFKMRTLDGAR